MSRARVRAAETRGRTLLAALALLTVTCAAIAQDGAPIEVEGAVDRAPATLMVGVHGGLPGYRNVGLGAALKADQFGVALRGGWGTVGASFGAQARWYPPLPSPAPLYVGVGVDAYEGNVTPHGVLGTHVPLARSGRLDVELGAARANLAGAAVWAPHLSVGVSYAFTFDVEVRTSDATAGAARATGLGSAGGRCEPGPARPERLDDAVHATVRAFVHDGVALYGNAYTDLRYRYAIERRQVSGDEALVDIRYSGSARAVVGGELVEAAGVAQARFTWGGCSWRLRDLQY